MKPRVLTTTQREVLQAIVAEPGRCADLLPKAPRLSTLLKLERFGLVRWDRDDGTLFTHPRRSMLWQATAEGKRRAVT
jgi:hypothetical protein